MCNDEAVEHLGREYICMNSKKRCFVCLQYARSVQPVPCIISVMTQTTALLQKILRFLPCSNSPPATH